jgi:hypothetical protein
MHIVLLISSFNDPFLMLHMKMSMMGGMKMEVQGDGWVLETANMKKALIARDLYLYPLFLYFYCHGFHNQSEFQ